MAYGLALAALVASAWSPLSGCGTDDGGFLSTGGNTGSNGGASSTANGGSGNPTNSFGGGATVSADAGVYEPPTTVDNPETPYVTTCDNCPASEPLHVQCSSGCCCAHYCEGQFGGLTDKPCCDEQGGLVGLNCVSQ